MMGTRTAIAWAIALSAIALSTALPAKAQIVPGRLRAPNEIRSLPVREGVASGPDHLFYGTITMLRSRSVFEMRLRSGRTVTIDAAPAIASGRYSAPLFVSKIVAIQGKLDTFGILHATEIERLYQIDETTRPDH